MIKIKTRLNQWCAFETSDPFTFSPFGTKIQSILVVACFSGIRNRFKIPRNTTELDFLIRTTRPRGDSAYWLKVTDEGWNKLRLEGDKRCTEVPSGVPRLINLFNLPKTFWVAVEY